MPSVDKRPISAERSARGRYFLDHLNCHFQQRILPSSDYVFDDALTVFILTSIATSERSLESSLAYWLELLNFIVQKLDLHRDNKNMCEDDKEERRR
jgi:hypothetical protein